MLPVGYFYGSRPVVRISGCYSVVAMDNRSINEVPLSVPLIVQIVSCFSCLKSYLP